MDIFMESCAEASWAGCDVGVNELEGVRPTGGVIESLGALVVFVTEGCAGDYLCVVMMFLVMFF